MIDLQAVNVELPVLDSALLFRWIEEVAHEHDRKVGNLTYRFCDDPYIIEANRKYLEHDYFTDIITFDYTVGDKIGGDMIISLDTVATNAETVGVEYDRELLRVIIHGVLHLCGINDKGPGEREVMEAHENRALQLYDSLCGEAVEDDEDDDESSDDWDEEYVDPDFDDFLKDSGLHM